MYFSLKNTHRHRPNYNFYGGGVSSLRGAHTYSPSKKFHSALWSGTRTRVSFHKIVCYATVIFAQANFIVARKIISL